MNKPVFILVIAIYIANVLNEKVCPAPEKLAPCTCMDSVDVECTENINFNLSKIFDDLKGTHYDLRRFYINGNVYVEEISASVFHRVIFLDVSIVNMPKLTKIHKDAFNVSYPDVNPIIEFKLVDVPLKNNEGPDYDLFKLIRNMTSLRTLQISNTKIEEIPHRAFESLTKLTMIDLSSTNGQGSIESIADEAFWDLPALTLINLHNNNIKQLGARSFTILDGDLSKVIHVELGGNPIDPTQIQPIVSEFPSKPVYLGLTHLRESNITFLNDTIFKPFLIKSQQNVLRVNIDCQDCRNFWLLKSDKSYPGIDDRLYTITCSSGTVIDSTDNFKKCT